MKEADKKTLTSVIGSTGAIVGAAGVTILASAAAPLVAGVITALGTVVAAGALYRKIAIEEKPHPAKSSGSRKAG